jgi:Domain of unknown function (DUF1835)
MTNDKQPLPPGVHIILGDSAGGIFNRVFGATQLLVEQDVLCSGPTRACETFAEWRAMRHAFWRDLIPARFEESSIGAAPPDDHSGRLLEAERIHIWAATSVAEQLFIAFILHRADELGIEPDRLRLVQFEHFPNRKARILGMGEIDEAQMAACPEPARFTDDMLTDYRDSWAALTARDPEPLATFAARRPVANQWLSQAMKLMLRRYPDIRTGLPHWDHVLLRATQLHAPRAARVIAHAMTEDWFDADLVGDYFLFGRLLRLAGEELPQPLLKISGACTKMRDTEVALTEFGREVLEGRASSYPANPIEDWAAGVRLASGQGIVWFDDGGRIVRG